LDIDRVCSEFKVKEFTSLDDGLTKTVEWNMQMQKEK